MPEDIVTTSMSEILTYEEILRVAEAAVSLGITHFRITGGEPLVRRGVEKLIAMIKELPGTETVTMTTNGVLLSEYAESLKRAGLDGLNVSLDTLDKKEFAAITGYDSLEKVLAGIEAAKAYELPIKLNAVERKEGDYETLISYAQERGLLLRFIEMMPIGYGRKYTEDKTPDLVLSFEKRFGEAVLIAETGKKSGYGAGPAEYYQFANLSYPIGFIRAMSHKFCNTCNRVRLTAEGKLKLCLCYEDGNDLRKLLRNGTEQEELRRAIKESIFAKRAGHCFLEPEKITEENSMVSIGG